MYLLVRTSELTCALPAQAVVEVSRAGSIAPLAGAPPFVAGLAVLRGAPLPVVDLGQLLGAAEGPAEGGRRRRLVTLRLGERRAALRVDAALGVRGLAPEVLEAAPPLAVAAGSAVAAVGARDGALLLLLEAARLVPEEVWRLASAASAEGAS